MSDYNWYDYKNSSHRFVISTVAVAERLSKAADRFLKPFELSRAQFNVMAILMWNPEGLSQARIGDELVVSRANVTGLVQRMLASGLIEIEEDPSDARIRQVLISDKGRKLMRRIEKPYFEEIERICSSISARKLDQVSDTLEEILPRV